MRFLFAFLLIAGASIQAAEARCNDREYLIFEDCLEVIAFALEMERGNVDTSLYDEWEIKRMLRETQKCQSYIKDTYRWESCKERWIEKTVAEVVEEHLSSLPAEKRRKLRESGEVDEVRRMVEKIVRAGLKGM